MASEYKANFLWVSRRDKEREKEREREPHTHTHTHTHTQRRRVVRKLINYAKNPHIKK
jgi:hypothetical protein